VFWISLQLLFETCHILRRTQPDIVRNAKLYPLLSSDFKETWTFPRNFRKQEISNIKFNRNPSSGNWAVPCGRADVRTDITKLIVAFRNSANALKNDQEKDRRFVEFAHWKKKYCAVRIKTSTGDGTTEHNFALLICNIGYDQTDKMLYTECSSGQYMNRT
jgi:hypothetical protein